MRCGARRAEFSGRAAGPRRRVASLFSSSPLTSLPLRRPSPTLPRSRAGRPRRSVRPSLSVSPFLFFVLPCSPAGCADASVASCGPRFAELATPLPLPPSVAARSKRCRCICSRAASSSSRHAFRSSRGSLLFLPIARCSQPCPDSFALWSPACLLIGRLVAAPLPPSSLTPLQLASSSQCARAFPPQLC